MKLILASNNKGKLRELREMLSDMNIEVLSQSEAGLKLDVEETGSTFAENALLKAQAACSASGEAAVADDSGLMVDALGGEPGIYSARYGGGLSDAEKCEFLLKNLGSVKQRSAKFVSSIACVFPTGEIIRAEGECRGEINYASKGENGFGYDPVFYIRDLGRTMAELSAEEKNAISHRGNALREFKVKLKKYMEENK